MFNVGKEIHKFEISVVSNFTKNNLSSELMSFQRIFIDVCDTDSRKAMLNRSNNCSAGLW